MRVYLRIFFVLLSISSSVFTMNAQTFRGELRGSVADSSGAAMADAKVVALNKETGLTREVKTGGGGDYTVPDLPPGKYSITATSTGFQEQKADAEIVVSRVSTIDFKLGVATQVQTAEVSAAAAAIETSSTALTGVVDTKTVNDLPMNGRDFRQMLKLSPGVNPLGYSVNGNRVRSNNFQIDGADNNDAFQNSSAVNQGGVSGVAGTLLPIEAIDQFAIASNGSAEMGRNGGSVVNLVIKSGTNSVHGSAYYFNRNEFFAANSPLAAPNTSVRRIRNQQYGFSAGGPIIKNRTFFFVTGEIQKGDAANAQGATTLSPAWIANGNSILSRYGFQPNQVSSNLVNFYPARVRTGPAIVNNYFSADPNTYDSYNGIVKIDHVFNNVHSLNVRYYGGTGAQIALVDPLAPFREYFQVAPSRMHNVSTVLNSVLTPTLVNNLVLGANYFKQTFNDFDTSPNPIAAGLNTGVTASSLAGSPTIRIAGFASAGVTQPLGRVDTTGHITDTVSWSHGSHQLKFGGEYRRALLDIFYSQGARGTLTFDGTRGPWSGDRTLSAQQRALADFLAGRPTNASGGASIVRPAPGTQVQGNFLQRDYFQNAFDLFVHDTWRINQSLSLNFGLRYGYVSPIADEDNQITTFVPGRGIVGRGNGLDTMYQRDWNNIAPRVGFAWQPSQNGKTVIRGGYGVFFDVPAVVYFASNNPGNGGAAGVNANPGGPLPVYTLTAPQNLILQPGVDPWANAAVPILGALSVNQQFATPYVQSFNLNVQQQVWNGAILQVGYVGTLGRKLIYTRDINAGVPGPGTVQSRRPYARAYPTLGAINQVESAANSNYNSFQAQLTQRFARGFTANLSYTFAKSIDNSTEPRNSLPANSYNLNVDRGPSDFDLRQIFTGFVSYQLPAVTSRWKWITQGWQLNALATAHTGQPINFRAGTDANGDGDTYDRINIVGDPFANVPASAGPTSRRWINPAAFAAATPGTTGTLGRNAIYGPAFFSLDPSIQKEFAIKERFRLQLRGEVFNVLNWTNFANPTTTFSSGGNFGLITNTRNGSSAPGIGFGEPRNVQLALKVLF